MAIEVKVNEVKERKREYPYLGRWSDGLVVLFCHTNTGTAIDGTGWPVGSYTDKWAEDEFTPLSPSESITLSNKA